MGYSNKDKYEIFVERTKNNYPEIWANYEDLLKNEKLSVQELKKINFQKRCEILVYAYENSPFYKRLYDEHNFNPYNVKNEADWNEVPCITKDMVREFSNEIQIPAEIEKIGRANNTGGSTGKPLKLFNDKRDAVHSVYWRDRGWWLKNKRGGVQK